MKKTVLALFVALAATTNVTAQVDSRLFNHLSVALNVGTTGIGADVSVPCTRFLDFEAGFSIVPKIKYNTNLHLNTSTYLDATNLPVNVGLSSIPIQGKANMVNGKFMINCYPFGVTSFHVTVGAFFGKGDVVEVYNTIPGQLSPINNANAAIAYANQTTGIYQEPIGLKLGDYLLTPDANGNARATFKTKGFKPYVGLGFGRGVPKRRLGFKFDLGAMFWGSPEIIDHNGVSLSKQPWGGKDGGALRVVSKIKVYPVLNFRLSGKIF